MSNSNETFYRVTLVADQHEYEGRYRVDEGVVKVTFGSSYIEGPVGQSSAEVVAADLLRKLVRGTTPP